MGSGCSCVKKKVRTVRKQIIMKGRTLTSYERQMFKKFMNKSGHIRQLVGLPMIPDKISNLDSKIPGIEYVNNELDEDIQIIDHSEIYIEIKGGNLHQHVQRGEIREFPNKQYELMIRNLLIDEEMHEYSIKGDFKLCNAVTQSIQRSRILSISTDISMAMNYSLASGPVISVNSQIII
jgi:hypothetical protein